MKKFLTLLLLLFIGYHAFSQTTLTEDVNAVLNTPRIVTQTSGGQIFYLGHQLGGTYSMPYGIFRAMTDNPNGTQNYFYDGVTNGVTNFSVRADGQGYFASNVGIGTTTPGAVLDVATPLTPGALGTVLARLPEGNNQGAGTYLGIKGYNTQLSGNITNATNVVSFAIEHSFYGVTNSSINFFRGGNTSGGSISFNTNNNNEVMRLLYNGNVLIGQTSQLNPSYKLDVKGNVRANQIVVNTSGADFVFARTYKLPSLLNLKKYIDQNHHLPEIPSAKQMKAEGLNLGDNQIKLLQKVEELTLYTIAEDKKIQEKSDVIDQQKKLLTNQQSIVIKLRDNLLNQQEQIDQLKKQLDTIIRSLNKN